MQRTREQQQIVETALTGTNMLVKAFAGTGKTTTLVEVAKELPKTSLYIAFNKSIADEASGKFPSHVDCRTIHSLAYRSIINSKMKKKLQGFYSFDDIIKDDIINAMPANNRSIYRKVRVDVVEVIKAFCQSSYKSIDVFIAHNFPMIDTKYPIEYWNNLINEDHPAKITHDVYLKLFHLQNNVLPYDIIYLDEAQDSTPVVLDIVLNQKAQIILVGDEYQSIYEWRGAINAMANLPSSFKECYLTESFRFTQDIADMATSLTSILGNTRKIVGNGIRPDTLSSKAIICRTNVSFLNLLLKAEAQEEKVFILGDLKELWSKMYHISDLYFGNKIKYPNKELAQYKTFADLMEAGEDMPELSRLVKLTRTLSDGGLTKNISRIKSVIVENPEDAHYTITTAHKSKGLEWDDVVLDEDMFYVPDGKDTIDVLFTNQTLELLYVAVTRAKYKTTFGMEIYNIMLQATELRKEAQKRFGI